MKCPICSERDHHCLNTSYLATVPDLGACFATGKTVEEAKAGLPDALTLHIEGMIADGQFLPPPRWRLSMSRSSPITSLMIEPMQFASLFRQQLFGTKIASFHVGFSGCMHGIHRGTIRRNKFRYAPLKKL